mmetsp:Transcript_4455/g.10225  ORF Transcript_4455/g.10225 Transcript_4455/m.10225 type:complete len:215 (-) Transcript_4455:28-672(-)
MTPKSLSSVPSGSCTASDLTFSAFAMVATCSPYLAAALVSHLSALPQPTRESFPTGDALARRTVAAWPAPPLNSLLSMRSLTAPSSFPSTSLVAPDASESFSLSSPSGAQTGTMSSSPSYSEAAVSLLERAILAMSLLTGCSVSAAPRSEERARWRAARVWEGAAVRGKVEVVRKLLLLALARVVPPRRTALGAKALAAPAHATTPTATLVSIF